MAAMFITVQSANTLLVSNPDEALVIAGSLVALGGTLTLRHILRSVGDPELTDEADREIDLLDAAAPAGLWHRAVVNVHAGLLAQKMGSVGPKLWWKHGPWGVRHRGVTFTGDPIFDPKATAYDWTDVSTLAMDETGVLR